MTVGATIVVGCVASKAPHPTRARALYVGGLFTLARAAAEADGRPWVILSALHGFLHPDEVVEPYDHTVRTQADRDHLVAAVRRTVGKVSVPVDMWCPARYVDAVRVAGVPIAAEPFAGLGIGYQRGWLANHARTHTPGLFGVDIG